MKLRLAIMASTALVPTLVLAQAPAQAPGRADPATAQSPRAQSAQTNSPSEFVSKATNSNLFEIQSSQLALQKSQNNRIREFAQKMVQDHTGAGDRLKAAAQGETVPTNLDQQHAGMLQQLQGATGPDFDRRYVQLQLTGHQETVTLFDQFAQNGDHPQLKQFAQQTLPSLREHLQMVQELRSALPPDQTAQAPGRADQRAENQGSADPSRIVVQQPAPTVRVDQASPQVTVQQPQPQVSVRQPQPEILVRQPQPTVTVDIPQPEIIVRMPRPDVSVAMAQPEVQVNQPQPQVQVVQPQQQPRVDVQPARPQVNVQQEANARPNVQVQGADNQPNVRYERAEPRVVVNQPQGQPQVRVEAMAEDQQGRPAAAAQGRTQPTTTAQQQAAAPADRGPAATGTLPGAQAMTVSRINSLNLYNTQGNELGDVERVVEGPDGKQYVVIGAGGFLGIGEKHVPIPLERVALRGDRLIVQGLTEDQIRAMPTFERNDRRFRELEGSQQVQINPAR
jgi:predicted outer membrane protein